MLLHLSSRLVRSTVMTNEHGQVMYKISSPLSPLGTTTIQKIKPNDDPMDMQDQFEVIGEIEWHMVGSSTFRLHGQLMESNDFIPSHGVFRRKRTFTGPDGLPYRWDMHYDGIVLSRDDKSKSELAKYHSYRIGHKAYLEVHPEAMEMLDLIILTFVYVEKLHMDQDGT